MNPFGEEVESLIEHALQRFRAGATIEPLYVTQREWQVPRREYSTLFGMRIVVDDEKAAQR